MSRQRAWTIIPLAVILGLGTLGLALLPQAGEDSDDLQAQITQVDTSAFPEVTVYVSVTDTNGESAGPDPLLLRLFEDGQPIVPREVRGIG